MKALLMADQSVGLEVARWLIQGFPDDLALIVTTAENELSEAARKAGVPCSTYRSAEQVCSLIDELRTPIDVGILAWWPKLVKQPLLGRPRLGFINTHPSLLPYNRGKHYNFWALVEQAPFGVSLHMVDDGIDSGDVIAQRRVPYDWEDTGETLYVRARHEIVELFKETYPSIRTLDFPRKKQDLAVGSFHRAAELEAASRVALDREYTGRELLNLLRARTFPGHPACWFTDEGETFEVRVEIRRKLP